MKPKLSFSALPWNWSMRSSGTAMMTSKPSARRSPHGPGATSPGCRLCPGRAPRTCSSHRGAARAPSSPRWRTPPGADAHLARDEVAAVLGGVEHLQEDISDDLVRHGDTEVTDPEGRVFVGRELKLEGHVALPASRWASHALEQYSRMTASTLSGVHLVGVHLEQLGAGRDAEILRPRGRGWSGRRLRVRARLPWCRAPCSGLW